MQEHWSQDFCWISDTLWYVLQNALSYYDEAIRVQIWIPTLLLFAAFFACSGTPAGGSGVCIRSMPSPIWCSTTPCPAAQRRALPVLRLPFFLFAAGLTEKRPRLTALLAGGMGVGFLANLWCYLLGGQIM